MTGHGIRRAVASVAVGIVRGTVRAACLTLGLATVFVTGSAWWQYATVSIGEPDRTEIVVLVALFAMVGSTLTAMAIGPAAAARWVDPRLLWVPLTCSVSSVICVLVVTSPP